MRKVQGYTIIEVTLVAMIAALIFLMVFLALPSMWANERDSERRTDVAYFINRLKNYQTNNNRGALPSGEQITINPNAPVYADTNYWQSNTCDATTSNDWNGFYSCYFNDSFMDPSGYWYALEVELCRKSGTLDPGIGGTCTSTNEGDLIGLAQDYTLHVIKGATCNGSEAVKSANTRNVAVLYRLERGAVYCENT